MPYSIMFSKTYARIKAAETRIQGSDYVEIKIDAFRSWRVVGTCRRSWLNIIEAST